MKLETVNWNESDKKKVDGLIKCKQEETNYEMVNLIGGGKFLQFVLVFISNRKIIL